VDENVCRKIVDLVRVRPDDVVVEIGPGTGALTRFLVERAAQVHAVEVDRELYAKLGVELGAHENLVLHEADILRTRIRDLIPSGPVTVVGNLPYHITSDLVLWLLEQREVVSRAVVMMQREVAQRLTAEPGERKGGSLSLLVNYYAEAEILLEVPPTCFRPVPKVHSSVVVFRLRDRPAVAPRDEALFFRAIRAAFAERRKTLSNTISSGLSLLRPETDAAIVAAGLDPKIRGEKLTLEEFRRLADALGDYLPAPAPGKDEDPIP